jgi:hypothetical protein
MVTWDQVKRDDVVVRAGINPLPLEAGRALGAGRSGGIFA